MGALDDLLNQNTLESSQNTPGLTEGLDSPLTQLISRPIDTPELSPLDSLLSQIPPSPIISETDERVAIWERKRWEEQHFFEVKQFNKAKEKQLIDFYLLEHPEDKELLAKFEAGEKPKRAHIPLLPELGVVAKDYKEILLAKARDWNYSKLEEMDLVPSRRKYTNLFTETGYALARFANSTAAGGIKFAGQVFDNVGWLYGPDTKNDKLNILERSGQALDKAAEWMYEKNLKLAPSTGGGLKAATVNAVSSALSYSLSLLALKGAGSPMLLNTFGLAYINDGQDLYRNAKLNGATEEQAQLESLIGTTIVGTIEGLQIGGMIKFGGGTGRASMQAVIQAAKQGTFKRIKTSGTELSGQLLHQFISQGTEEAIEQAGVEYTPAIHGQVPETGQAITNIGTAFIAGGLAATIITLPTSIYNAIGAGKPNAYRQAMAIAYDLDRAGAVKAALNIMKKVDSTAPATLEQSKTAHQFAEQIGFNDEQYRMLAKQVTGKESTKEMTGAEASAFLNEMSYPIMIKNVGLDAKEEQYLADTIKDKGDRNRTMAYFLEQAGKMPEEPQMKKEFSNLFKLVVLSEKKAEQHRLKEKLTGKSTDVLAGYLSARYVLGDLEMESKIPFRRQYDNLTAKKRIADLLWENDGLAIYEELNISPFKGATTSLEDFKIAQWLDEADPVKKEWLFSQFNPKIASIALKFRERFQNKIPTLVRMGEWKAHKFFGKPMPRDFQEFSPELQKSLLKDYNRAYKEGKLEQTMAMQTWGTRANYYPHIGELDSFMDSVIPSQDILRKKSKNELQQVPGTIMTRESKTGELVAGSVMQTYIKHASRLQMFVDSAEDLKTFWDNFQSRKPSFDDQQTMNSYMNVLLGRRSITRGAKWASSLSNMFWKFHFLSPVRTSYFYLRNLMQNIAFLHTQIGYVDSIKAIYSLGNQMATGKLDVERLEDFEKDFNIRVDEKNVISQEFMFQEYDDVFRKRGTALGKYMFAFKWLTTNMGKIAISSDTVNRKIAWNIFYDNTKRLLGQYKAGQIDWNKLSNSLQLRNLHPTEQLELMGLLNRGDFREATRRISEYKTENIHFRYDTALRAPMELDPLEKALWGLVTYPRGVLEITYQQGIMPMYNGFRTNNWKMARAGMMTICKQLFGLYISDEILYKLTGKHSYSMTSTVLGWSPLSPGLGSVYEYIKDLNTNQYRYENDKTTFIRMLDGSVGSLVNSLAWMLAMDTVQTYAEAMKDQRGRTAYKRLKQMYYNWFTDKFGKPFDYEDRNMWQAMSHALFGGFETVPETEYEPVMPEEKK